MVTRVKQYAFWGALSVALLLAVLVPPANINQPTNDSSDYHMSGIGQQVEDTKQHRKFSDIIEFLPINVISQASSRALEEIKCMAYNNFYEAGNQGYTGMLAVSQVTVNRMGADGFPSSACGVVHHKTGKMCQFSWVCQRKLPKLDYTSDEWKSAVEAAAKAYYGDDNIPALKNALFYHAVYVKPGWKKYKKLKKIGDHVFYGLV